MGKAETRYIPTHPQVLDRITEYLEAAGHAEELNSALIRSIRVIAPYDKRRSGPEDSPTFKAAYQVIAEELLDGHIVLRLRPDAQRSARL